MRELREAIARAIWEAWRMSVIAPEDYRDFSWEELCDLAAKYPDRAPGKFREVALIEADAALAAIEAQGVRLVWMKPSVLPGPQRFGETTITMTEPEAVEVRLGGTGGGPTPRPRSEGQ